MIFKDFKSSKDFIKTTINLIKKIVENSLISGKEKVNIALSGGNTPKPIYQALAETSLPWEKIDFYQVDERYIEHQSEDSNYKLIKDSLFSKTEKPKINFHYFDTKIPISESLEKYAKEITEIQFDLVILGMGTDGHIASIFPIKSTESDEIKKINQEALKSLEPTIHTQTEEFAVKDRLTISFSKILESKEILILIKGKDKLKTLNSPKDKNPLPFQKILEDKNPKIFYLDQ